MADFLLDLGILDDLFGILEPFEDEEEESYEKAGPKMGLFGRVIFVSRRNGLRPTLTVAANYVPYPGYGTFDVLPTQVRPNRSTGNVP